jgi:hypothetical protein
MEEQKGGIEENPALTKIQEKLHEIKHNQGYIILVIRDSCV